MLRLGRLRRHAPLIALGTLLAHAALAASGGGLGGQGGHAGIDMLPVLEALALILVLARLGGALSERLGQPAVLGELMAGIVIGNLGLVGFHAFDSLRTLPVVDTLAQIGVLFLLFQVGLESDVAKMAAVGASATLVAVLGVLAPMLLGLGVSEWFLEGHHVLSHWFVGATLAATSVGITARVLGDLGRSASVEGRIILGAAVIDDVLGLLVLAVVTGLIQAADAGRAFDALAVAAIVGKALGFLVVAVVVGRWLSRVTFRLAARLPGEGMLLSFALAFCFFAAYLAGKAGLAPIVGAFAAGLVLEDVHYEDLRARDPHRRDLHHLMAPLSGFLVPVFFVLMGMGVDVSVFAHPGVLGFAAALTVAAVLGKQICSLGVLGPGVDRLAVGLGMIPRGEVGLIFASIGRTLHIGGERVVDDTVYSAVVVMVAVTTLVTPPLLVWRMRGSPASPRDPGSTG
jgi:Kef-type K+ transport system membrane component KefB